MRSPERATTARASAPKSCRCLNASLPSPGLGARPLAVVEVRQRRVRVRSTCSGDETNQVATASSLCRPRVGAPPLARQSPADRADRRFRQRARNETITRRVALILQLSYGRSGTFLRWISRHAASWGEAPHELSHPRGFGESLPAQKNEPPSWSPEKPPLPRRGDRSRISTSSPSLRRRYPDTTMGRVRSLRVRDRQVTSPWCTCHVLLRSPCCARARHSSVTIARAAAVRS